MRSRVQSSAYCRIGDEPMKVAASMVMPTSWDTRTIGSISAITVRAAQFGAMGSWALRISVARARTCSTTRGPAPGKADVGRHDAQLRHQVEQPLLDLERGVAHGGGLQAVAQRLVVQVHADAGPVERRPPFPARAVPVVDQLALVHEQVFTHSPPTVKRVRVKSRGSRRLSPARA